MTLNQRVLGSSPSTPTNEINNLGRQSNQGEFASDRTATTRFIGACSDGSRGAETDPTVKLHAQITEGWARIAADGGHADYEDHPPFEVVTDLEVELASTPPRSVEGLILLLRQAFADLVPFNEGTDRYEEAVECRTYGAVLLAIETLEAWQRAAATRQPDAPAEGRG